MAEHSIHGARDSVIQRDPERVDEFVEGAFHLINHTHPEEVNAFIAESLKGRENLVEKTATKRRGVGGCRRRVVSLSRRVRARG